MALIPFGVLSAAAIGKLPRVTVAGYFAGGNQTLTTVNKLTFATDTLASTTSTTNSHIFGGAFANSGVAGYVSGFSTGVSKLAFPADTASSLASGRTGPSDYIAAFANSGVAGYFGGGGSSTASSIVDKYAFPGDTRTTLGTGLSTARWGMTGVANNSVAGYFCAGRLQAGTIVGTVDKFAFPSDTRSTLGSSISPTRFSTSGMADDGVAGYVGGGNPRTTSVNKITFSTDTISGTSGISVAKDALGAFANSAVAGYIGGGESSGGQQRQIDKFAFPADSRTTLGLTLSNNYGVCGMSNQGVF
jgi:hypothetical protein